MAPKPISHYLAPGLLVLGTLLAAVNWYFNPARPLPSAAALILLGCMMLALRLSPRPAPDEAARRRAGDSIMSGVVFGGLIVVASLSVKLAATLGAVQDADLSRRAMMAILGAFIAFTGNAIPKTLTPLSTLECDAAKAQAFQRFAGWTWALAGLALAMIWLVLPVGLAETITFLLLPASMLVIGVQVVRLRRTRERAV